METSPEKKPKIRMYFAVFMDVLGQGNKLRELRNSEWWNNTPGSNALISDTYASVQRFRMLFQNCIDEILHPSTVENAFLDSNPPDDQIELWRATHNQEMQIKYIADSIICTLPMLMNNGILPFSSIQLLLHICCQTVLTSLADYRPIRGGIAFGPCIYDTETNDVYGSAISVAVELEKEAGWPRILVDPVLVEELKRIANSDNTTNSSGAKSCLDIISLDEDERYILDYLGQNHQNLLKTNSNAYALFTEKPKEFILSQISKHQGDAKLQSKYEKVREYFRKNGII